MKAIDIIMGLCSGFNKIEACLYLEVPEYESEEEFRDWIMGYFGFVTETPLKPGVSYLVVWDEDEDEFYDGKGRVSPDIYVKREEEQDEIRFYEICQ